MKKAIIGAMLFALAMTPVLADGHVTTHAEIWNRYENVENYFDQNDDADDAFDFGIYRARLGVGVEFDENISGMIEVQNYGNWGNTTTASGAQNPVLSTFTSGFYDDSEIDLYQAFVQLDNIGDSNFSLKFGRQEHVLGNELLIGDRDFYAGRSFDGLRGMFDFETWELNLFYYLISEENVGQYGGSTPLGGSDDSTFFGAHASFDINDSNSIEPYVLVNRNGCEGGFCISSSGKMKTMTIGALYDFDSDDSQFDGSFEYALQTGEMGNAGDTDISSWIAEGAFGYDFGDGDSTNRLGVGLLILGDGDDANDEETFQFLYGDVHQRAGASDFFVPAIALNADGGFQDIFVDWNWNNGTHGFGAAYHMFSLFEDNGGEDDLGSEIDLSYNFTHGENFGVEAGVAMFDPGDAFAGVDDGVMRIYAMGRVRK